MSARILVVEDRDALRRLMQRALEQEGYQVATAENAQGGRAAAGQPFDLAITDLMLPDGSGLDVLAAFREKNPAVPVVVLTGFGSVQTAVQAMKLGAADFLEKPLDLDQLSYLVRRFTGEPRQWGFDLPGGPSIVGQHPRLRAALRLLEKVAPTESTVLLTGESGTGKELFARGIHLLSKRKGGAFVAVNCAAIPEALIENELFGHEKGAFTGASSRQIGRFEQAKGGTLFLDEIGELPLEVQGKVLRALEERTFERVGSGQVQHADVRFVAATNRPLKEMVAQGRFRQDLFYRLEVFPLELPALRERASDIPELAQHLLRRIAEKMALPCPEIEPEALAWLTAQPWPGNVRQLSNCLERALILASGGVLRLEDLEPREAEEKPAAGRDERDRVKAALKGTGGDKEKAAALLGISYRTLLRRVEEFDLEGYPRYRDD
jgi:DNA-binding NtrC family response regulator